MAVFNQFVVIHLRLNIARLLFPMSSQSRVIITYTQRNEGVVGSGVIILILILEAIFVAVLKFSSPHLSMFLISSQIELLLQMS